MKKTIMSVLMVGLLCSSAFPFKLGLEFQAGDQLFIGTNMRFSDFFELKPQLGFQFADDYDVFNLLVSGNFYLPDLGKLQHYAGLGIDLGFVSDEDAQFVLDGHYGLRYDINEVVSIFGQVGLGFVLAPEFAMTTYSSGAGITFYVMDR